ncbi:MAG: nickel-dependent hydrogenase large subunit, partial [Candidatus Heimdallarchaeota archaeon]
NKTEQVAVYDGKSYPFNKGNHKCLLSGKEVKPENYKKNFIKEEVRDYSTAKFSTINDNEIYYVSPMARVNINHKFLTDDAKAVMKQLGLKVPNFNPFNNNLARVIELMHCVDEALEIIDKYIAKPPKDDNKDFKISAGTGSIATEAPRGLLNHSYTCRGLLNHSYTCDKNGIIKRADVITPTAHNVGKMEDDAKKFVPLIADKKEDEIKLLLNMLIRSYDPCISCSAHAISVDLRRK